jgi:ATP-dependent Clp protease protease subunit
MKRNYFSMEKVNETATINIYGDITSWAWEELGEMSAVNLSKQLEALGDVNEIHVFINSYGGEVAEGLAIYNALKRHKAKVTTYCDGFACSIASVIFMAGDERVMSESSLLMIHNAWTWAQGNAEELRKQADDLEKITQASVEAYKAHSSLTEKEIKNLMDHETWILPEEALSYGFATSIDRTENKNASQNAFLQLFDIIKAHQEEKDVATDIDDNDDIGEPDNTDDDQPNEPETTDDDSTDDDSDDNKQETATQKMCGFFNAILKL